MLYRPETSWEALLGVEVQYYASTSVSTTHFFSLVICSVSSVGRAFGCYTPSSVQHGHRIPKGLRFEPVMERFFFPLVVDSGSQVSSFCIPDLAHFMPKVHCLLHIASTVYVAQILQTPACRSKHTDEDDWGMLPAMTV